MSKIPQGEWSAIAARYKNGESITKIARSYLCTPPAIHYILKRHRQLPAAADRPPREERPAATAANDADEISMPPPTGKPAQAATAPTLVRRRAPAPSPAQTPPYVAGEPDHNARAAPTPHLASTSGLVPTPGLDEDLHHRAEAAIELFRASFDAALIEGSPGVRERLRRAAADLMRVAARTTIVLDRSTAGAERAVRAPNYPRSAHMND
jgi:hypothetical protein